MFPQFRFSRFIAVVLFFMALWSAIGSKWKNNYWKDIIVYDGKGYYSYLPAVFIYQDLQWGFMDMYEKKHYEPQNYFNYAYTIDGRKINKYFCGVAVMQTPFFLTALAGSRIFGIDPDGYTILFQLSVSVAALFYFSLGIYFLSRLLIRMNFSRFIVLSVLLLISFATNLFYYASSEPCMSHVYSFCAVAGFLLYLKLAMDGHQVRHYLKAVFFFGLVCIIRPTNGIIILALPFFAGSWKNLSDFFKTTFAQRKIWISSMLVLFSVLGTQVLLIWLQTGKLFVWSYEHERFYFDKPELFNVLFSYKKGLFIYTPLVFVSLFGFFYMARENKFKAAILFTLLFGATYILSCWWLWYYGGSFGMRPFIDYYPFTAILLAILLTRPIKLQIKILSWTSCAICLYYTHVQTWQYRSGMLHYSEMNQEKYWKIFMSTSFPVETHPVTPVRTESETQLKEINNRKIFFNDFDTSKAWGGGNGTATEYANSGTHSIRLDSKKNFSSGVELSLDELGNTSKLWLRVTTAVRMQELSGDAVMVYCYKHGETQYVWNGTPLKDRCSGTGKWVIVEFLEKLPAPKSTGDKMQVYFFNTTEPPVYLDDVKIEIDEMK